MENFTLEDIQQEITSLSKSKEEIDRKITSLELAMTVLEQKKPQSATNEYANLTSKEICLAIISENKGIKSAELIEIARNGGAPFTKGTFSVTLSSLVKDKKIKVRKIKGFNKFYSL